MVKKANIVLAHKQLIKNYRPVSLLPVCTKRFEEIIFNSLFKYLEDSNLLNGNQSGFHPGDSCVHQLLSITHEIYKVFDANPSLEVRVVFLGLSKTFDKVWHKGFMYKLKCSGICRKYFGLIHSFLMIDTKEWSSMVIARSGQKLKLVFSRVQSCDLYYF